ncbi:hypothetical protein [Ralstonia sp. ASV6]|uniref:hypothetical protein n=1 Tax=Ralstonia sp. ASV6 TaxID=2795124 RepID=UPI0018EA40F6|nr:hypothetical protein [Ralstonia sp. ASV6]
MTDLLNGLQKLATRVASDFVVRGGRLLNNDVPVTPELLASPTGGLGALLWMVREFADDYDLPFAGLRFHRSDDALTGYVLSDVLANDDWASMVTLIFGDVLRNEILLVNVEEWDVAPLLEHFRDWAVEQGVSPEIAPAQRALFRGRQPE